MSAKTSSVPAPELVAEIRALSERRLTPEEFARALAQPMSDDERAEILASIDWFTRRYPTAAARLAWARRAYARWQKAMPPASPRC